MLSNIDKDSSFHEVAASPDGRYAAGLQDHRELKLFRVDQVSDDGSPEICDPLHAGPFLEA